MVVTKVCANPECRRDLPLSEFYARSSSPDGRQSWCKSCSRAKRLEWAEKNRSHLRKLHQQTHRRRMADPERAASERVRKREWERRARGTKPENYRTSKYMRAEGVTRDAVDSGPFADWLRWVMERTGESVVSLSARLNVADKTLREVLKGRRDVELATVERALIADDTITLRELYPSLYGLEAAQTAGRLSAGGLADPRPRGSAPSAETATGHEAYAAERSFSRCQ